ncbi:acyl carrier protein (plasmid) [Pseudonocardia bannensis]|uniref:Acyl carrier protein n=1 Tax=Pseudonocardia bannensis TaxID=630973 RepID=A0A848DQ10_9PSEU|nr:MULTISPECIES: acyl carrier protein [Pseudonocardia]NMH94526.1 acyl carrier protein [Pseudonocardia bannensis]
MTAAETGFSDVVYDLVSVEYHALKGGYVYGQYVRDAENEGHREIAEFFRQVTREDAARAEKCHRFLLELSSAKAE